MLGEGALEFTTLYVDNLLMTSDSWEQYCMRTEHVLSNLRENNITLKLNKSKFLTDKVKLLGFILSRKGIQVSGEKVQAIQKFPTPKHFKQLQSFLRM